MSSPEPVVRLTLGRFLTVSAVMEVGAGLALLAAPALPIGLLLGVSDVTAADAIGRVAGAGLLSLGVVCWGERRGGAGGSRATVVGMLIYNLAIVGLVLSASLGPPGPLLLSVAVLHAVMAVWCLWLLRVARN